MINNHNYSKDNGLTEKEEMKQINKFLKDTYGKDALKSFYVIKVEEGNYDMGFGKTDFYMSAVYASSRAYAMKLVKKQVAKIAGWKPVS